MVEGMDLPSNSHKAKTAPEKKAVAAETTLTSVVINPATRKKKAPGKRFMETFIRGDAQTVGGYMLWDVLIPAAKDAVADAFSQGIESMLFGESRGTSRRGRGRSRSSRSPHGYVDYGGMSRDPRDEPRRLSNRGRSTHNFDEIELDTRDEAQMVLERMGMHLDKFEFVTVADMLALCNLSSAHTDQKWGWDSLADASVVRTRDGYLLDLPRPKPID